MLNLKTLKKVLAGYPIEASSLPLDQRGGNYVR